MEDLTELVLSVTDIAGGIVAIFAAVVSVWATLRLRRRRAPRIPSQPVAKRTVERERHEGVNVIVSLRLD